MPSRALVIFPDRSPVEDAATRCPVKFMPMRSVAHLTGVPIRKTKRNLSVLCAFAVQNKKRIQQ